MVDANDFVPLGPPAAPADGEINFCGPIRFVFGTLTLSAPEDLNATPPH